MRRVRDMRAGRPLSSCDEYPLREAERQRWVGVLGSPDFAPWRLFLQPELLRGESHPLLEQVIQVVGFVVPHIERDIDDLFIRGYQHLLDLLYTDISEMFDKCHRHLLGKDRAEMGGA